MWKVRWQWQAGGCSECVSLLLEAAQVCTDLAPELDIVIVGITVCAAIAVTIQLQIVSMVVAVSRMSPNCCVCVSLLSSSSRLALA